MRKIFFIVLFIVIGLSYIFELDKLIAKNFTFFNDLKLSYINKVIDSSTIVEKHFNQVANIQRLKDENTQLRDYKILYTSMKNELQNLKDAVKELYIEDETANIELVKVLSYIKFNDFTKVWLDKKKDDDSILGLITDDYAAGIVVNQDGRSVALLNGNKDCSYAVFIGGYKAPGIVTSAKDGKNLKVKYIPVWADINEGDEVITSGMDDIFFEGLKVGRVKRVQKLQDMQIATVEPYAEVLQKKYFYTYEKLKTKSKKPVKKKSKKKK